MQKTVKRGASWCTLTLVGSGSVCPLSPARPGAWARGALGQGLVLGARAGWSEPALTEYLLCARCFQCITTVNAHNSSRDGHPTFQMRKPSTFQAAQLGIGDTRLETASLLISTAPRM